MVRTFTQLYESGDAPLVGQYAGFIKHISAIDRQAAVEYWQTQLKDAQRAAFPATADSISSGAPSQSRTMTRQITFPRSTGSSITKATILRTAWAIVVARYCETDDVCFGVTVSGRNAPVPGLDRMAGPAVATVPVRVRLDQQRTVSQLLQAVQTQASEMIAFEQFGLQNIARISPAARKACDFASLLVVQPMSKLAGDGGADVLLQGVDSTAHSDKEALEGYFTYPLVAQGHLYDDRVELVLLYHSDKISESRLEALTHHFDHVVQQLILQDDRLLSEVSLAGAWDVERAASWNTAPVEVVSSCAHTLIAEQVVQRPHAEAVVSSEGRLTYAELDRLSTGLAIELIALGVRPETMVPLCFEKSMWYVVAVLATLKAGGAFVPIDPSHPEARRQALLGEIGAQLLLVSPSTASSCSSLGPRVVEVSPASLALWAERNAGNVVASTSAWPASPDNAAYAIFTSGSTGKPKTIVVEHRGLCTTMVGHGRAYSMDEHTRLLQFSNYAFDPSVSDICTTLALGGTLCVPTDTERLQDVVNFINRFQVNISQMTPSFVSTFTPAEVPCLRTVAVCGEAPTQNTLDVWCDHVTLINAYGPAEACIDSTFHIFSSTREAPNTIGKRMNGPCWIVEPADHNRLTAIGCVGELLVQGAVARGYLNDPQRTQDSFVSHATFIPPSHAERGCGFYKTGDLVRYGPDGNIQYLGRQDTQVKVRGQRVELGAIETAIKHALPSLIGVAVDIRRQDYREALVAFLQFSDAEYEASEPEESHTISLQSLTDKRRQVLEELASSLQTALPSYMVPSLFLPLLRMPHNSSMKLDRKRLRELADGLTQDQIAAYGLSGGETVAPTTEAELQLREVWAAVLKIDAATIGKHDNFLQIGGDSISAIQLVAAAREHGIGLTVADIFANSQLSRMAAAATFGQMAEATTVTSFSLLPENGREQMLAKVRQQYALSAEGDIEDAYPCSALQEGLMALAVKQPGSYIAKHTFRLPEHVDLAKFKTAWEQTVARCEILRTRIVVLDGVSMQILLKDDIRWNIADESSRSLEDAITKVNTMEMQYGHRLCQYETVSGADGKKYFILVLHHAVFDGWTLQLIMSAFHQAYNSGVAPSMTPYSQFIRHTTKLDTEEAISYWRTQLADVQRARFPRSAVARQGRTVGQQQTLTLSIDFPSTFSNSVTKATILRAAWAMVLARYNDTNDICFGTTVSGRNAPVIGLDRVAGPTVATVPIRVRLHKDQSVAKLLQSIQTQASEMIAYEQFGLQNISKISAAARDACDFTSLLVVQPMRHIDPGAQNLDSLLLAPEPSKADGPARAEAPSYFSYPLVLQCMVYEERVDLNFTYDSEVLNSALLKAVSHQFNTIVKHFLSKAKKSSEKPSTKKKSKK
jgi:amino acid adenylation domain-containing protein